MNRYRNFKFWPVACAILLAFLSLSAHAQVNIASQVITSDGGYVSSGSNSMSYTIGEPVVTTIGSGDMLTQGFQQTLSADLAVIQVTPGEWQVTTYPNPTKGDVTISITTINEGFIKTELTNVSGQVISVSDNKKISVGRNDFVLHLSQLAAGNYFISLFSNGTPVQTIKVVKE